MQFGLYLQKKGIISAEQLVDALEAQMNTLVPIGQIALEEGILSARDIFDVLRAQKDSPNERFGDVAIEMGLMTRDHVMRLLMIQADRKRPLAEILVGQGALSQEQMEGELAAYRQSLLYPRSETTTTIVPIPYGKTADRYNKNAMAAM